MDPHLLAERDEGGWFSPEVQLPGDSSVHHAWNGARIDQQVETVQRADGTFSHNEMALIQLKRHLYGRLVGPKRRRDQRPDEHCQADRSIRHDRSDADQESARQSTSTAVPEDGVSRVEGVVWPMASDADAKNTNANGTLRRTALSFCDERWFQEKLGQINR